MVIYVGTVGYSHPYWKSTPQQEHFYPVKLAKTKWFGYYIKFFDTVESNMSFYGFPKRNVWIKWKDQAPKGFKYCMKVNKYITHSKRIKDVRESWENKWENGYKLLGDTLGVLLFQFPPQFKCNDTTMERLRELGTYLPKSCRFAFEFRDSSWNNENIRKLFLKHKNWCVIFNFTTPTFLNPYWAGSMTGTTWGFATTNWTYLRLHGSMGDYVGTYGEEFVTKLAKCIEFGNDRLHLKDMYIFFDNTDSFVGDEMGLGGIFAFHMPEKALPSCVADALLLKEKLGQ